MISYAPLWKTMREKEISQYKLLRAGVDNKMLDALKKGRNITLLTLEKFCLILNCTPNEVAEFTQDNKKEQSPTNAIPI